MQDDLDQWPPYQSADEPLTEDEVALMQELGAGGTSRREFLAILSAAGVTAASLPVLLNRPAQAQSPATTQASVTPADPKHSAHYTLNVNGIPRPFVLDARVSLLDLLRESCALTGTKKGCDHGQCGACTVLVNGERVLSCLTLAAQVDGDEITTIEGLAKGDELHPLQTAFIKHDGFQCGYCTPGQICSGVALASEIKRGDASHATEDVTKPVRQLTDDEIRERMSGNLCRCGAYPNIVKAIKEANGQEVGQQTWRFVGQTELAAVRAEIENGKQIV